MNENVNDLKITTVKENTRAENLNNRKRFDAVKNTHYTSKSETIDSEETSKSPFKKIVHWSREIVSKRSTPGEIPAHAAKNSDQRIPLSILQRRDSLEIERAGKQQASLDTQSFHTKSLEAKPLYYLTDGGMKIEGQHWAEIYRQPGVPRENMYINPEAEAKIYKRLIKTGAVHLQETATPDYNSHSYTFTNGKAGWLNDKQALAILQDQNYYKIGLSEFGQTTLYQQPHRGDVIAYYTKENNKYRIAPIHTGVVSRVHDGQIHVSSKWGKFGRYEHNITTDIGYGKDWVIYRTDRPGGRLLQRNDGRSAKPYTMMKHPETFPTRPESSNTHFRASGRTNAYPYFFESAAPGHMTDRSSSIRGYHWSEVFLKGEGSRRDFYVSAERSEKAVRDDVLGEFDTRENSTPDYNCHSYTFTNGKGGWLLLKHVETILKDHNYYEIMRSNGTSVDIKQQPRRGDVILYSADRGATITHSGVVSRVKDGEIYINSKWGRGGRYEHLITDVPEVYGKDWTICRTDRPGGRLIQRIDGFLLEKE